MINPVRDYGAEIDWSVGALFCHEAPLFQILRLCEKFGVEHPIRYVFGSIPSIMAGGRVPPASIPAEDAPAIMDMYLERGIACRLTLSNPYVMPQDIEADKDNAVLLEHLNASPCGKAKNGVILTSDILAEHVRDTYPNLEVVLSIIRPAYDTGYGPQKDTLEYYTEKLEDPLYDIVVVNAAKIYEEGFMEALPRKEKVELLASHACVLNCPRAKEHYDAMLWGSLCKLYGVMGNGAAAQCNAVTDACLRHKEKHPFETSSFNEQQIRWLVSLGFRHFKLAGRLDSDGDFQRDVMHYVFQPERVRHMLKLAD